METRKSEEKMLNIVEAAELLGVHTSTLATWRCYSGGPFFIKRNRRIFYPLSAIERFARAKGGIITEEGA